MAIEPLELKPIAPVSTGSRIEVFQDAIVFHDRNADGTVNASQSIKLAELIANKDTAGLLLYALFMQNNQMVKSIEESKQAVADLGDPWDPETITSRMKPMLGFITPLLEAAGINPEAIGGADKVLEALGAGESPVQKIEQGHGVTRTVKEIEE